mgnify:CR=1 FL=1
MGLVHALCAGPGGPNEYLLVSSLPCQLSWSGQRPSERSGPRESAVALSAIRVHLKLQRRSTHEWCANELRPKVHPAPATSSPCR